MRSIRLCFLLCFVASLASVASANWTQEPIASYGLKSALAVGATGAPHVAFTNCYWHGACSEEDPTPGRLWYAGR